MFSEREDLDMSIDFYFGCLTGLFFATFVGIILQQIQLERRNVGAHKRPLMTTPQRTPADMLDAHRTAVWRIMGWVFVLVTVTSLFLIAVFVFAF
jgi:hypothetical protein